MKKGTSAKQNIALLRYARSIGMTIEWNMLTGFPGDREEWYSEIADLVPYLSHLEPPGGTHKAIFQRFSPYHDRAADYGITNLRPVDSYALAFPQHENLEELAYHFIGDCEQLTNQNSESVRRLKEEVISWRSHWDRSEGKRALPSLEIIETGPDDYLLIDTRPIAGVSVIERIDANQAAAALSFHTSNNASTQWAVARRASVKVKGGYMPWPVLLREFFRVLRKSESPTSQMHQFASDSR